LKIRRKIKMEKISWFVCIPIVFGISFVINTILAIVKGNKKFKVRAIIDAFLGMLSVFPALFYYGILSMRGPSCTSNTPAGHLILIIIIKIYCMVKEKELVKEW
jgi:ABC-type tungstate transport system substrate-binding protein